ncbi:MAG TPA: O-antigen ligase family protein [Candidatus Acidoferrum sp.]|jgi:O-antigen ligase|nr:O-antigen ligase family protein [Candidatus Acidoferrum sp.]
MTEKAAHPASFFPLLLIFLGILAVLSGWLVSLFCSPAEVFGPMAIVFCAAAVMVRWPYGGLLGIVVASVLPHFSVVVGGWNVRPEHYAVVLVLLAFWFRWVAGEKPQNGLNKTDYYLLGYLGCSYVSSASLSPDRGLTLRWALLNSLAVLPYFLIKLIGSQQSVLRWLFRVFLGVGVAESAYSLISFAAHHALGSSFGVGDDQYAASVSGVYGTLYEPNFLGAYAGSLAIMFLVLYLVGSRHFHWLRAGFLISFLAMVVSLSRAALLGFAALLIIEFLCTLRKQGARPFRLIRLATVVVLFAALVVPIAVRNLSERFQTLSLQRPEEDPDTLGRMVSYVAAIQDILRHPVLGNGAASFQLLAGDYEAYLGARPWVGNVLVRILHDTGLIGFAALGVFLWRTARRAKEALQLGGEAREMILAMTAGGLIYAISFQATDGTMLAFFWVHMGILGAAVAGAESELVRETAG